MEGFIRNDPAAPPRALVLHDNKTATEPYVFMKSNNRSNYVQQKFLTILSPDDRPFEHGNGRLNWLKHPSDTIRSPQGYWSTDFDENIWAGDCRCTSDFGLRGSKPSHLCFTGLFSQSIHRIRLVGKNPDSTNAFAQAYQQSSISTYQTSIRPTFYYGVLIGSDSRGKRDALLHVTKKSERMVEVLI